MAAWIVKNHHVAALFLLVAFFFPLFWISQYNYPSGDDYPAFFHAQSEGTFGAIRWWYVNWSGRYAALLVQSLFPEYESWLVAYRIIPIVLLSTGFGCMFYFAKVFFGARFHNSELFTLSSVSYIFLVSLTPDIVSGFYWLPASVSYLGAVFITLLLLGLYVELERASNPLARGVLSAMAVALIGLLAGLNEVSVVLFIGTMVFVCLVQFIRSNRPSKIALTFLSVSILFGLLSFLAPGNFVRASQTAGNAHLIRTLGSACGFALYVVLDLITVPPLLLASGLYLVFLEANRDRIGHLFSSLSDVRWYWVLGFLACATFVSVALIAAVNIHNVAGRVRNVYLYSLTLGWFFLLTVLFVNLTANGFRFVIPKWTIGLLGAPIVVFLLTGFDLNLAAGNFIPAANRIQRVFSVIQTKSVFANAYLDILSGRAARYGQQNEESTNRFKAAKGGCVELARPSHAPGTIFLDWVKYPSTWCPAEYRRAHGERSP